MTADELALRLLPQPQRLILAKGALNLRVSSLPAALPAGEGNAACRQVLEEAISAVGLRAAWRPAHDALSFTIGTPCPLPALPTKGFGEGYVLRVTPEGVSAKAASERGLLYAAITLRQLVRVCGSTGKLPALTVVDWPEFRHRGIYIEGGQERFGYIVSPKYLIEQIKQAAHLKLNCIVIECYNLFPFRSFPACADAGTLTEQEARDVFAAAHQWHVTLIPSLQTLAQAYELVWQCDEGATYREVTAPGQMCPSTPEIYPFIKELYRDLLGWFDETPLLGIGCSEIEMQWQGRYCPKCRARLERGETPRDLLIGHALKCIQVVEELSGELQRPIRPFMWGDEFYMYGPATDWVGLDRIPKATVIGYWKYWPDYSGINGLMERGYDVLGISAIYNHTFYFVDLSPEVPEKSWPAMEQTNGRNIAGLMQAADAARKAHPQQEFLGTATASFSKHRLRAFDTLWWGFALNAQYNWSYPSRDLPTYQPAFTRAFVQHYYDACEDTISSTLAGLWAKLDEVKSDLELANQTLHDVVGVYDTQEAGYVGNSLFSAVSQATELFSPDGKPSPEAEALRKRAEADWQTVKGLGAELNKLKGRIGHPARLRDLWIAQQKIEAHLSRQLTLLDTAQFSAQAASLPAEARRQRALCLANLWDAQIALLDKLDRRTRHLYEQGDPLGFDALRRDMAALASYLRRLSQETGASKEETLLEENFARLDTHRWLTRGEPVVADNKLHTSVTGGWENYCGIATRQAFQLDDEQPLVVEFTLTPVKIGVDSQLVAGADETGQLTYTWALAVIGGCFSLYTRKSGPYSEQPYAPRGHSMAIGPGRPLRVRVTIGRTSVRATVWPPEARPYALPLWDSGPQPMDQLDSCHLLFADVEPPGSSAASEWSGLRVFRVLRNSLPR